ncbi:MAG: transcription-repair coupling factor [Dehalogenimonas sp.]|uniref:Transcription-repair-coupling factor n=1 Tax=Candidatus Dehalogenimonas loeffleri TaxID=3127115 RepID=A0ABZ2J6X4_9CHLR|nr:transcription-repair coupling factor [Dehalogenimonas sp.]
MTPKLKKLFYFLRNDTSYLQLINQAKSGAMDLSCSTIESARSYVISSICDELKRPCIVITHNSERAKQLTEQLSLYFAESAILLYPYPELLPYQRAATDRTTQMDTILALARITGLNNNIPQISVIALESLLQHVPARDDFVAVWNTLVSGTEISPMVLTGQLVAAGYRQDVLAEVPGSFSRRGGIIDIFSPTEDYPFRLEFFGDTIESIRLFDPGTQRSIRTLDCVELSPASLLITPRHWGQDCLNGLENTVYEELLEEVDKLNAGGRPETSGFWQPYVNKSSLIDYVPTDTIVFIDDPELVARSWESYHEEAEQLRIEKETQRHLPTDYPIPYLYWQHLHKSFNSRLTIELRSWGGSSNSSIELPFAGASSYSGRLPAFFEKLPELLEQQKTVIILSYQSERLQELLKEKAIPFKVAEEFSTDFLKSLTIIHSLSDSGWVLMGEIFLFTDLELFGFIKTRRQSHRRSNIKGLVLSELNPGDFVVHIDHGIAQFKEIINKQAGGTNRDYLLLEYAAGDRLYVPTDQIERVGRYIGTDGESPVLNRLGTLEWTRSKEKAQKAAEEMAEELVELYANRQLVSGYAYSPDTIWQRELEGSFPYVETPDQIRALDDIKTDMEKPQPMDRLILGDVGYGKTEVALRAAFKAVMDGRQVAILVPTTVLAQQHYVTFKNRLAAFPLKLESLSRFRSESEQCRIIDDLACGVVDIVIGTHRLLQSDVRFNNLGLVIIDEEQRFGVMHKEFLKKLRQEVDVLTLSATPIPRTLQLSLTGVRDMSIIETPPQERLPVKTIVAAWDDNIVREAILRELERGGQVFFVHNRVASIYHIAAKLQKLVPEASFTVGHGQMPEHELEMVMSRFTEGTENVLVCTTIIESGVDVPNANTIIINHADRFGLTQLYQLRGRVGRGTNLAYSYLLYEKDKRLTETSLKRLKTIYEAAELGAGYSIAMKDLEIRGAGTLLGTRQSGQISAVGFNLYTEMLSEAVEKQQKKHKQPIESNTRRLTPPSVDLPIVAYIPETYIANTQLRLRLYQRLTAINNTSDLTEMENELSDRFGPIPSETADVLFLIRLRIFGVKIGIKSFSTANDEIIISFHPGLQPDFNRLRPLKSGISLSPTKIRIKYQEPGVNWRQLLEEITWRLAK